MTPGLMMDSPLTVTSILIHAERFHPDAEIISRLNDRSIHRYQYRDFCRRVRQLANALTRSGVKAGDRVATLAWNHYRHLEVYYAVSCIGAICHTINPRLFREQLTFIINDAEDSHLFFDIGFVDLVADLRKDIPCVKNHIAFCDEAELPKQGGDHIVAYESLIADQPTTFDWPELDERQACSLCYTSGTTGDPKGVLFHHRSTLIHALAVSGGDWLALRARDAVLPVVPMFHACAWGIPYAALMAGTHLVLPGAALDGASLTELIQNERVTMIAGVPTVWLELLRHLDATDTLIPTVERMMVGGAAAPISMISLFEEKYNIRVIHGWGMTEISPVGTLGTLKRPEVLLDKEDRYQIQARQGRPLFGIDLRLVGGSGDVLPHDGQTTGALQVRGPWVASAYYKNVSPESFTDDGWFITGDVAAIDQDGYLRITDRTKDVIKSGGEWISSIALENVAVEHPQVAEAACIGVYHSKWGERPLIVVVAKSGAEINPQEVLDLYRDRVASWWVPDHVEVVDDLPHTPTGKLSKLTLRQRFQDYRLPGDK